MTDSEVPQDRTGRIRKTTIGSRFDATKPLTLVSTWRGKKLDEYNKAELIEIVIELGQSLQLESHEHSRQLDVLTDLVAKGFKR